MRKLALLLLSFAVIMGSCTKKVKVPLSYTVESPGSPTVDNAYIADSGVTNIPFLVKFLTGYPYDSVTVKLSGVPAHIKVQPDSFKGIPTYTANYMFTTSKAPLATYPLTLTAKAPGSETKTYNFNLIIKPSSCAAVLSGTYNATSACTGRNHSYTAVVTATGKNTMSISNLGGYGVNLTYATINCNRDSIYIASQNIGNGNIVSGVGTFTGNKMTIYYKQNSTVDGTSESCTSTLTKQ
jgi:hypothetical protein